VRCEHDVLLIFDGRRRRVWTGHVIGDRWGVTDAEVARRYPCDELVPRPTVELWRGVTVDAPPERVWPWVRQVQLAPYSYDWLDNLGRRSPRELRDVPEPLPGGPFSRVTGLGPVGRVLTVTPGEQLTARILGATMSYVLLAQDGGTRLLLKIVTRSRRGLAVPLGLGDWPMARKQLLTWKTLAEQS
jgi:hypothetical protein